MPAHAAFPVTHRVTDFVNTIKRNFCAPDFAFSSVDGKTALQKALLCARSSKDDQVTTTVECISWDIGGMIPKCFRVGRPHENTDAHLLSFLSQDKYFLGLFQQTCEKLMVSEWEDVSQEFLLTQHRRRPARLGAEVSRWPHYGPRLRLWIRNFVRDALDKRLAKRRRHEMLRTTMDVAGCAAKGVSDHGLIVVNDLLSTLRRTLKDEYIEAFRLCVVMDCTYPEAAALLECSPDQVEYGFRKVKAVLTRGAFGRLWDHQGSRSSAIKSA
jgi:hypothetical protein